MSTGVVLVLAGTWLSGAIFGYLWRYFSVKDMMYRGNQARQDRNALDVMDRIRSGEL